MGIKMADFKLDRLFLKRLWILLKVMFPYWTSASIPLTIYVLIISALDQFITYYVGVMPSEFYVVMGNRDAKDFRRVVLKSMFIIMGKCLTLTAIKYSSSILYIQWRRLLCYKLHHLYYQNYAYYAANYSESGIDNPDQRITQDVERLCLTLADIFAKLMMSPFIIAYYTYKTYSSSGYLGPLAIYSYFVISTIVNKLIMSPIVGIIVRRERYEGDFRFKHVVVRTHAESIAFFKAGLLENCLTNQKLETLLNTQQKLVNYQFALNFSMSSFDYFGSILSYLIIAVPIFVWKSYDNVTPVDLTGIISQNSFFYMYLINSFSTLVDMSSKVSEIAGTTHRVGQLMEFLQKYLVKLEEESFETYSDSRPSDTTIVERNAEFTLFNISLLSFSVPNSELILIRDLSLEICSKQNVLITGDSGTGKTALFRVLRGFWQHDLGAYQNYVNTLFLPQKPYCTNGSLRQQIVYPMHENASKGKKEEVVLLGLLEFFKLAHIVDRCSGLDTVVDFDWQEAFSPGELQRLAMTRILYHKPKLVFLDEVTSAVGLDLEEKFYRACDKEGISYVSIGHRESLKLYHQRLLHFIGDGQWTISDLQPLPYNL